MKLEAIHQAVLGRRRSAWYRRGIFKLALWGWKLCRLLPGAKHIRGTLRSGPFRLRVRLFSYDDLLVASEGYEPSLRGYLPRSGGVAIDAGAFIGRHTLEFARAVGPYGRVVALEPVPANYQLLVENIRLNGARRVVPLQVALGADDTEGHLSIGRETSTAALAPSSAVPQETLPVRVRSLDSILAEHGLPRVDLLKIDVEGAELEVLAGATATLRRNPGLQLVIEVHSTGPHGPDLEALLELWLSERGYQITRIDDAGRLFFVAAQHQEQTLTAAA